MQVFGFVVVALSVLGTTFADRDNDDGSPKSESILGRTAFSSLKCKSILGRSAGRGWIYIAKKKVLGRGWIQISAKKIMNDQVIVRKKAPWLDVRRPKIAERERFPWQVAVIIDNRLFCSGSLVGKQWVLTAAHCTLNYLVFDLAIGSEQTVRQSTMLVTRHPEYDPAKQEKDLALLKLPSEVTLSPTVNIVRLPKPSDTEIGLDGMELIFTGWASLKDRLSIWAAVSSPPLMFATVRGVSDDACKTTYGEDFSSNKLCLDTKSSPYFEGVLSLADGGAPIVLNDTDDSFTQIGVLSFGAGPSMLRPPVVATKLFPFLFWIDEVIDLKVLSASP